MPNSSIFKLLFSLFIASISNAQTILISKTIPVSNRTSKFKLIGKNTQGYWVRNYGKNEERVDIYDDGLNLIKSKTLLIKRNNFTTVSFFLSNYQATIYYSEYKKKQMIVYANAINDRLESGAEIILDTVKYQSYDDNANVSFATSTNKMYHMLFIPTYLNGSIQKIRIIGTNGSSFALFKSTINISEEGFSAVPQDAIVDNNGNTYLLIKYFQQENQAESFMVYQVSNRGQLIKKFPVYFDKQIFGEPYIIFDELHHEFIATAYTTEDRREGATYFTTYRYSLIDSLSSSTNHYKIDKQIISDIYKGDPGKIIGLYTYTIKKIILTLDRGLYVFTESFYKESKEEIAPDLMSLSPMNTFQPSFNNTRSINIYHYNDILCMKLNDSIKSFNYELIDKSQISENDNGAYSSFVILNSGDAIKCLYNAEDKSIFSFIENTIDGSNTKQVLINEEKKGLQLIPKMAIQTGINELIIPSYRNDEFKLIKIKY